MEPYRREQTRPWSPSDLALNFSLPLQRIKKCEILGNILNWAPSQMSASVVVECSVVHLKIPDAENRQLFHWPCPPVAKRTYNLRPRKHPFLLPPKDDRYFVSRVLFK